MRLFGNRKPLPVQAEERASGVFISANGGWFGVGGNPSESDPLRSVAHWAARRVLCTSVAGLPVGQVSDVGGRCVEVEPSQIVRRPSMQVSQTGFVYQLMDSWLDDGNAYGLVVAYDSAGFPVQVESVAPASVRWRPVGGMLVPHVDNVPHGVWPNGDLWHVPCYLRAGSPVGLSPTELFQQSVRTATAAEKFGGDFFEASGHPTYDVAVDSPINESQAREIKAGLRNSMQGRTPWVHGSSIKATPMAVSPSDSQFIDLLRFECEQASRIYGVPPSMIYAATSGSSVTYSNASQGDLQFMKHSLRWWVNLLQEAWSEFLPNGKVLLDTDDFLSVTALERAQLHETRLRSRTISVNEVRDEEGEPRFDNPIFDEPGVPGGIPAEKQPTPPTPVTPHGEPSGDMPMKGL